MAQPLMPREPNATSLIEEAADFTRQRPGGTFIVIKGPDRGEQVTLSSKAITFGSAPNCDLVLSDKTVSRRHVEAYLDGNQTIVRDLGSTTAPTSRVRASRRSPSRSAPRSS